MMNHLKKERSHRREHSEGFSSNWWFSVVTEHWNHLESFFRFLILGLHADKLCYNLWRNLRISNFLKKTSEIFHFAAKVKTINGPIL